MSHKLLIGLEFDGEYDPRVRAELEQMVATLQAWQPHVSPNDAEYLVGTASDDLTNERVATNSDTISVDRNSTGLIKWHAKGVAAGSGFLMAQGGIIQEVTEPFQPMLSRPSFGSTGTPSSTSSSSSTSTAGGHVHGVTRIVGDGTTTTFNLADIVEYIELVNRLDPTLYSLSSDHSQIVFTAAPLAGLGNQLEVLYVIANL